MSQPRPMYHAVQAKTTQLSGNIYYVATVTGSSYTDTVFIDCSILGKLEGETFEV